MMMTTTTMILIMMMISLQTFQRHSDLEALGKSTRLARGSIGRVDVAPLIVGADELPVNLFLQHPPEEALLRKNNHSKNNHSFMSQYHLTSISNKHSYSRVGLRPMA